MAPTTPNVLTLIPTLSEEERNRKDGGAARRRLYACCAANAYRPRFAVIFHPFTGDRRPEQLHSPSTPSNLLDFQRPVQILYSCAASTYCSSAPQSNLSGRELAMGNAQPKPRAPLVAVPAGGTSVSSVTRSQGLHRLHCRPRSHLRNELAVTAAISWRGFRGIRRQSDRPHRRPARAMSQSKQQFEVAGGLNRRRMRSSHLLSSSVFGSAKPTCIADTPSPRETRVTCHPSLGCSLGGTTNIPAAEAACACASTCHRAHTNHVVHQFDVYICSSLLSLSPSGPKPGQHETSHDLYAVAHNGHASVRRRNSQSVISSQRN